MNFRLIALNIREFCPVLSLPVIKQRINIRYKQILAAEKWEFMNDSTTVRLRAVHSLGSSVQTVAVNQAGVTVTGTGTTFTSDSITGWKFRFGSESQPYIIRYVGSDTNLALETSYGGTTQTASAFEYFKNTYSPEVGDVGEIASIVYKTRLVEKSPSFLNSLDPERTSTGEPLYWSNLSKTTASDGIVTFEIWPLSDQDYVITVNYKKTTSDLSDDSDSPVFRAEVLEAGALWDCFRLAFAITQNPAYIGLARDAKTDFEILLRQMVIEDLSTSSLPQSVRDITEQPLFDDNFRQSHDVDW